MKKYTAEISVMRWYKVEIEADSEDEAAEIAAAYEPDQEDFDYEEDPAVEELYRDDDDEEDDYE